MVFLALLVLALAPAGAAVPPGAAEEIGRYLSRLEKLGFAGAVLVAADGGVVHARGYGLADRDRRIPWTTATVSSVGSITKQFTGAALMRLVAEGKLSTEDTIDRFFADVPADKRSITVHHLLTHTAGLTDILGDDFQLIDRDELVAMAMAEPLVTEPGDTYAYSNLGYSLLGAIVEKVSGQDYESFLRRELLAPAGLFETGYRLPEYELGRVAVGYRDGEEWGTVLERDWLDDGPSWHLRANGGIHSTVYDMLRWIRALDAATVLPADAVDRMLTPAADEGGGESFYGYGWAMTETDRGTKLVFHSGGNGILFSDALWFRDEDRLVFMMTNVGEYPAERITPQVAAILFGEPVAMPPAVVAIVPTRLAGLAGVYRLEGGGDLQVTAAEGRLEIEPRGPGALRALYGDTEQDGAVSTRRSERIAGVVGGILEGDYQPLTDAYGGLHSLEALTDVYSQRVADLEARMGPAAGFEVLGTAADDTFFRIDFRDGAFWGRYLWDDDRLDGLQIVGGPPRLVFYPTAAEPGIALEAFELGSGIATRVIFPAAGRLVVSPGEGERVAVRTAEER